MIWLFGIIGMNILVLLRRCDGANTSRSVYHAATPDYLDQGLGERTGQRAVSLGEKPFFDPLSTGRREAFAQTQS